MNPLLSNYDINVFAPVGERKGKHWCATGGFSHVTFTQSRTPPWYEPEGRHLVE